MDIKTINDIALISSEDLLEELGNRFDSAIFAGIQVGATQNIMYRTKGSLITSIGMAEFIKTNALKKLMDDRW